MSRISFRAFAVVVAVSFALASLTTATAAEPPVTYQDNVAAIFQAKCNACHNNDKQKGGLVLENYAGVMKGGGSGAVIEPGDAESSRLFALITHAEEPKMPPMQPKLPDAELNLIKAWIIAGAPENAGGKVAMKAKPKLDFKLDPSAIGKPQGPPAMPEGVSTEPVILSNRANAITALAASPWAPLVAVSGHKQVLLYHTGNQRLVGVFPFPEGTIHVLKFSRDGGLLLAGGGRGGQAGRAVAWDVKTGKRLFEIGKEFDVALAADVSPDRSMVALGGPNKLVRVYGTSDGELIYECKKHTEWVTALEFSPDGVLLASGDRNGGLVVWEAPTGREFYDLRGHTASITDVSWRLDSNVLASSSEDTTIKLWEMQNGNLIKNWGAHGGGVESVRFAKDGRLVSTGRDRVAKLWDQNGGQQRQFEAFGDIATKASLGFDDASMIAGDWSGELRVFEIKEGKRLGNLSANPPAVATRLLQTEQGLAAARSTADAASKELAALQQAAAQKANAVNAAQQAVIVAQQDEAAKAAALANAERVRNEKAGAEYLAATSSWLADYTKTRLTTIKTDADSVLNSRLDSARGAASTFLATGLDRDRILAERAAAALTAASRDAEVALPPLTSAVSIANVTRVAAEQATAARVAADAPLPALRQAGAAAAAASPARRNELAAAVAAKAAADKAVSDKAPVVQSLVAKAEALKADAEALTAEKKAADTSKRVASATAP
jgi:Planctomycete cytochrome C/WD domain, G-beta repeat